MSKFLASSLALGAALVWCQGGFAQQQEGQRDGALFDRIDANKDGVISADEVSEDRKSFFERLVRTSDKNKDGKISREEFAAGGEQERPRPAEQPNPQRPQPGQGDFDPARFFRFRDTNGDGKLAGDEIPEPLKNNLSRVDKDSDGAISQEEFKANSEALARMFGRAPGGVAGQPGGPPNIANSPFFRALDSNGDGKIAAEELAKAADALKTLDRNNDGVLTPEELAPPGGPPGQPGRPNAAPQGAEVQAFLERIKQADKNGDGKLSKEEAPDRLKENFDRIDANSDGFIDQAEAARLGGRRPQGQPGQGNPPRRRPNQDNKDNKDDK